ncbi:hypothetical protein [Achromobacter phage tuull]|nr:hypothetical protein [Achromobacter phage tuull]
MVAAPCDNRPIVLELLFHDPLIHESSWIWQVSHFPFGVDEIPVRNLLELDTLYAPGESISEEDIPVQRLILQNLLGDMGVDLTLLLFKLKELIGSHEVGHIIALLPKNHGGELSHQLLEFSLIAVAVNNLELSAVHELGAVRGEVGLKLAIGVEAQSPLLEYLKLRVRGQRGVVCQRPCENPSVLYMVPQRDDELSTLGADLAEVVTLGGLELILRKSSLSSTISSVPFLAWPRNIAMDFLGRSRQQLSEFMQYQRRLFLASPTGLRARAFSFCRYAAFLDSEDTQDTTL